MDGMLMESAVGRWLMCTNAHGIVLIGLAAGSLWLLGHRISPRTHGLVWGLVLLRFAVPDYGRPEWFSGPTPLAAVPWNRPAAIPSEDPADTLVEPAGPALKRTPSGSTPEPSRAPEALVSTPPLTRTTDAPSTVSFDLREGWWAVWLLGFLWCGGRGLIREWRFQRALRHAQPCPRLLAISTSVGQRMGILRPVPVLVTETVSTPAVVGMFRSKILVPLTLRDHLDEQEWESVLAHELAHARRPDVLVNGLLFVLQCVHWFNPTIRWAVSRFQTAREAVRDQEALSPSNPPRIYGRTLLRLAESCQKPSVRPATVVWAVRRKSDLYWRIAMLVSPAKDRVRSAVLGTCTVAVAVLAVAVGTGRVTAPSLAQEPSDKNDTIIVIRDGEVPAWKKILSEKLETKIDADFDNKSFPECIAHLARMASCNIVLDSECADAFQNEGVSVTLRQVPIRTALSWLCAPRDLAFDAVDEVVYVGSPYRVISSERRIYRIGGDLVAPTDDNDNQLSALVDFLRETLWRTHPHLDSLERAEIRAWNGVIIAVLPGPVHDDLYRIVRNLQQPGSVVAAPEPWRHDIDSRLDRLISASGKGRPLEDVVPEIQSQLEDVRLVLSEDLVGEECTFDIQNLSARRVLDWIARTHGVHWEIREGAVHITHQPTQLNLEFVSVRRCLDSIEDPDEREMARDELADAIRSTVHRNSWDLEDRYLGFWKDVMVVRQSSEVQRAVQRFVDDLAQSRAVGR